MPSTPAVSIIVPVYNVEKYIERCLDSIIAQTFTDWECILVDDGSPDASGRICDEYASKDSRFGVIHKKNGGVSSARNAGLDAARGEWIGFVDPDDWIESETFRTAIETAEKENADIVQWDYKPFGNEELISRHRTHASLEGVLRPGDLYSFPWYFGMCWLRMYSRKIFEKYRLRFPVELTWMEDTYVSYLSLGCSAKTVMVGKKLYHYFHRPDSAVGRLEDDNDSISKRIKCIKLIDEFAKRNSISCLGRIIYSEKLMTKNSIFLGSFPPDYDKFMNTFPECNRVSSRMRLKEKIVYFLAAHHLKILSAVVILLRMAAKSLAKAAR